MNVLKNNVDVLLLHGRYKRADIRQPCRHLRNRQLHGAWFKRSPFGLQPANEARIGHGSSATIMDQSGVIADCEIND